MSPSGNCALCGCLATEAQASLAHTHIAAVADDEMVQRIDVKPFSCADNLARDQDVLWRWLGISRRVIMAYNNGGAIAADGLFEDLADAHHRGVEGADVDCMNGLQSIFRIKQDRPQLLLIQM